MRFFVEGKFFSLQFHQLDFRKYLNVWDKKCSHNIDNLTHKKSSLINVRAKNCQEINIA